EIPLGFNAYPGGATRGGVDRAARNRLGDAILSRNERMVRNLERPSARRRFQLILLKPSHYGEDGYVIRWWRAIIPSNSLAAVYGLAVDCARRQVLGTDVPIDIDVLDEGNTYLNIRKLIRRFRRHDNFGLLALVGVQS